MSEKFGSLYRAWQSMRVAWPENMKEDAMKKSFWMMWAGVMLAGVAMLGACEKEVQRVVVPPPTDPNAYEPVPQPKPLPPQDGTTGMMPGQPMPGNGGNSVGPAPSIKNEDAFLQAYTNRRSPRIMVFVNRTIQGDPLPKDGLEELYRIEKNVSATGTVLTKDSDGKWKTKDASGNISSSTSVKMPADKTDIFGATSSDYEMIELAVVSWFDNSGKVQIRDSEAARAKLDREKILRIENGDPAAMRLLAVELQQDVLIRITAKPTKNASWGNGIRLLAKATSTTDGRILGAAYVDMPLPLGKSNVNAYTRYLSEQLMGEMAKKWLAPPEYDPIEVRIYKVATVDDSLKIRKWLQQMKGVTKVDTRAATGGSTTAYGSFGVAYAGAPEDLYGDLKAAIGASTGIKAVDLTNNTITLEMTGPLTLTTTTRAVETKTTVEKTVTETKTEEPINPAPK